MEADIQLILSELINAINRPDWWAIGVTVANVLVMIWLGWNQYKLQKQQTELQKRQTEAHEYEIYRRLYQLVSDANDEIDEFLNNLYMGTWQPHIQFDKDFLSRKLRCVEQLKKDLNEKYLDYKLKFSRDSFNADGYLRVLSQMSCLLQQFNESMTKGDIDVACGPQRYSCERGKEDEAQAFIIASRFKPLDLKEMIMGGLMHFVELKNDVRCSDEKLNVIKEKCRIV